MCRAFLDVGPSAILFDIDTGGFRGYACWLKDKKQTYFYSPASGLKSPLMDALHRPALAVVLLSDQVNVFSLSDCSHCTNYLKIEIGRWKFGWII